MTLGELIAKLQTLQNVTGSEIEATFATHDHEVHAIAHIGATCVDDEATGDEIHVIAIVCGCMPETELEGSPEPN